LRLLLQKQIPKQTTKFCAISLHEKPFLTTKKNRYHTHTIPVSRSFPKAWRNQNSHRETKKEFRKQSQQEHSRHVTTTRNAKL
jgi:heme-degrading monooxygenase HmoA